MFRIRCLTTGEFIIVKNSICSILFSSAKMLPKEIKADMNMPAIFNTMVGSTLLEFTTETSAQWFINRRLTYNPKRQDHSKLLFMKNIFDDNNLPEVTVKVEFEVVEVI